jgi:hypothetical protein
MHPIAMTEDELRVADLARALAAGALISSSRSARRSLLAGRPPAARSARGAWPSITA